MNIAALSSQLQRIPDQALAQEMRYPSGAVPQFLILTELQRRQKMRASSSDGDIPASTVAQDVMGSGQQRTPPAGLPAIGAMRAPPTLPTMPVTGMYRGGQVRRFAGGTPEGLFSRGAPGVLRVGAPSVMGAAPLEPRSFGTLVNASVYQPDRTSDRALERDAKQAEWERVHGKYAGHFPGYSSTLEGERSDIPVSRDFGMALNDLGADYTGDIGSAPMSIYGSAQPVKRSPKRNPMNEGPIGATRDSGGSSTSGSGGGSSDDEGGLMSIYKKMRESGEFDAPKADRSKLEQLMALQQQQGPGLALAKAGFKMASGTSPFFATNAGEGLAGLSDDLRQQNIDSLKGQLELEGLSAKEAEAEATRRYNMLRLSGDVLSHRDAVDQRREAALGRLQEAHYARLDRLDRVGEAARARGDGRLMSLYGVLDRGYNTAYATAQRALEKERAAWQGDMANMGKPFTKTIEDMDSWTAVERAGQQVDAMQPMVLEQFGVTLPAPAAADPRGKPGNKTTRPPLSSFGG